nr:SAM-dependent chlorinase/fluorinase [Roseospirillum parvum]
MLHLFTDFGLAGPYMGQMHAAVHRAAPPVTPVTLLADAPTFDAAAAAHLLAALVGHIPPGEGVVAVVDPGVGTARRPLALKADGRWLTGPDNGLLSVVGGRARQADWFAISWRPDHLSASFHGRDLFAPVAARLLAGEAPARLLAPLDAPPVALPEGAGDRARVIAIDAFGNLMTGLRASHHAGPLTVKGRPLPRAGTFGEVPVGQPLVYANSLGLLEIAVNQGHAARVLGLAVGDPVDPAP